jgi:hypothetical protein
VGVYSSTATVQKWLLAHGLEEFRGALGQLDGSFLVHLYLLEDTEQRRALLMTLGVSEELHSTLTEALTEARIDLVGVQQGHGGMHMSLELLVARLTVLCSLLIPYTMLDYMLASNLSASNLPTVSELSAHPCPLAPLGERRSAGHGGPDAPRPQGGGARAAVPEARPAPPPADSPVAQERAAGRRLHSAAARARCHQLELDETGPE